MSEVYRNLHRGDWSIREGGLVVAHRDFVLVEDARFVVQPAGRARVLREKRKNVHAFVRGEVSETVPKLGKDWGRASYNPYRAPYFVDADTGERLDAAKWVLLTWEGLALYVS